jgi:enoyl-CoA hydratase/carnithine racemase
MSQTLTIKAHILTFLEPMTSPHILLDQSNGVATITLSRPERRNALNQAMYHALSAALREADADVNVRAIVLTGAGGYFTAGNDLSDFIGFKETDQAFAAATFLQTIYAINKPLVAAVEGGAVGVGATMLQHCDFVYAGRGTRFSFPFVQFGLPLEGGLSLALAQGPMARQVARWVMLGDPFTAEEACAAGLLTQVTEDGHALATANATAARLSALNADALRASKEMIRRGRGPMAQTMTEEIALFTKQLAGDFTQSALRAFSEKSAKKT